MHAVERYVDGFRTGDHEAILGCMTDALRDGGRIDALFCDVFEFRGDRICRLVTYQVDRQPGDRTRQAFGGDRREAT